MYPNQTKNIFHVSLSNVTAYLPLADACPMFHEDRTGDDLVIKAYDLSSRGKPKQSLKGCNSNFQSA